MSHFLSRVCVFVALRNYSRSSPKSVGYGNNNKNNDHNLIKIETDNCYADKPCCGMFKQSVAALHNRRWDGPFADFDKKENIFRFVRNIEKNLNIEEKKTLCKPKTFFFCFYVQVFFNNLTSSSNKIINNPFVR